MKTCSKCSIEKPLTEFSKCKANKDGLQYNCKTCNTSTGIDYYNNNLVKMKAYSNKYYSENLVKIKVYADRYRLEKSPIIKNKSLKLLYNITLEEYNIRLFNQKGCCAICNTHHTIIHEKTGKSLHVDHCHTTGKVRGLLCHQCNSGLGNFKDNIDLIKSAINYLV